MKEYRNLYFDGDYNIYADITDKAKHIFGEGLVKRILFEVDHYYNNIICNDGYRSLEERIDGRYNDIQNILKKLQDEGSSHYMLKTSIIEDTFHLEEETSVIVEFINGTSVLFSVSEWGRISKIDK